ncbi:UNVERIFIED_CONTAM: hypothetical protein HDU68_010930 [Siphonaria sp. JEL0065]|nr:hypothetical protein HDU68_010930 [Siphonaria sp. JEL0065]
MKFTYTLLALAAVLVRAQDETSAVVDQPEVSAVATADAPASPATVPAPATNPANTIVIISPTGTKAYKSGETITVTWTNKGDPNDWDWWGTPVQFEIADASLGVNRVSPIGVYLAGNATIGDLQLSATLPTGIPAGGAYCVRADIKGPRGFTYFFSPNFPINQALGAPAAVTTAPKSVAPVTTAARTSSASSIVARFVLAHLALAL